MADYLYYCKNCNTLEVEEKDNLNMRCLECDGRLYPTHVTDEMWDELERDEKRQILRKAAMPQANQQRVAYSGRENGVYSSDIKNNSFESRARAKGYSKQSYGNNQKARAVKYDNENKKSNSTAAIILAAIFGIITIISMITIMGGSSKKELKDTKNTNVSNELVAQTVTEEQLNVDNNESVSNGAPIAITEQVLVDQDGVKITAVEYETHAIYGDGIKLLLENNTAQNLTFGCDALIVNDFMITDLFVQSVASGKSAYETMYLANSELKQAGIDNVGKVEMYFRIYDSDTWDDLFVTDCVTLQTSDYASMDSTIDVSGIELYNKNNIRIMAKYVDENSFWGKAILIYVENNTEKNISVSIDDLSVNGFMFSPLYSDTVYAGKKSFDDITLFESELQKNGVSEVKDVELKFKIYDKDTYDDIDMTEAISFSVQ